MTPTPLASRRVVDLSQYIAGPVCGQLLADFGATVLKVEPPTGDPSRSLPGTAHGSVYYRSFNTGKDAVALDLRDPDDRACLDALLADADALVMNFGQRTLRALGLTWEALHAAHPHLVVTIVTAYGYDDPRTTFDSIAQAVSGYAMVNADEHGRPRIAAGWPTDVLSGTYAGMSTAMALLDPSREGVLIDVSMDDVALATLVGPSLLSAAEDGTYRRGRGDRDAATCPSGVFSCADGFVYVYAGMDKHWALLQPLVGGPEGATSAERLADPGAYHASVEAWTAQRGVAEVCAALEALGIPAGPVRDPVSALATARGGVVRAADGEAVPQFPVSFSGARPPRRAAPARPTRTPAPDRHAQEALR